MVLIDMEMPKNCYQCDFSTAGNIPKGTAYCTRKRSVFNVNQNSRPKCCPLREFTPPEPQITTNIYDTEEIHHGCTVQVLRNSVTGETSVGWWKEKEEEE